MTKKQVWRYYCDFCRKGGLSAGHMGNHEKSCTANPNRICRMHAHCEKPQLPIGELIATLAKSKEDCGIDDLRKLASGCPVCMLAAVRQSKMFEWDGDLENPPLTNSWDFKVELAAFWKTVNEAKAEEEQYRYA